MPCPVHSRAVYTYRLILLLLLLCVAVWFPSLSCGTAPQLAVAAACCCLCFDSLRLIYPLIHAHTCVALCTYCTWAPEKCADISQLYKVTSAHRTPNRLAAMCLYGWMDRLAGWLAEARWSLLAVPLAFYIRTPTTSVPFGFELKLYVCLWNGSNTYTEYHHTHILIRNTFVCIRKGKVSKGLLFSLSVHRVAFIGVLCLLCIWLLRRRRRRHRCRHRHHHCLRCCCCRCIVRLKKEEKIFGLDWCACSFLISQNIMYMLETNLCPGYIFLITSVRGYLSIGTFILTRHTQTRHKFKKINSHSERTNEIYSFRFILFFFAKQKIILILKNKHIKHSVEIKTSKLVEIYFN